MRRPVMLLLVVVLIVSILVVPGQSVHAQGITLPAEINKTFTPISIPAGGTSLLRITVFNPNTFPLTNTSWTDNLPAGVTVVNVASNTCGGTVTAPAGAAAISLSGGTVPAQSASTPGSCTVSVNVTSTTPGNWINTIPVGALTASGGGTTISNTSPASATLNVTGTGTPSVAKSFSPSSIWSGGTSQLTIDITNNANVTLTGASLTDDLPAGVSFANPASPTLSAECGSSASVNLAGTSLTLNNGAIPPGARCRITVEVTGTVQGRYTNTIPARALKTNQNLTNTAPATDRLTIREIGLSKSFGASTIVAGQTVTTLTITLQNPKSTPYTGATLTDNLPAPLVIAGVPTSNCGVPPGVLSTTTTSVHLAGGTIPPGSPANPGSCTISVPVTAPAGSTSGRVTNTIPPTGLTTDQRVGPLSSANASVTVSGTGLSAEKSFTPTSITAGTESRLRITITAPSDTDLTNLRVRDDLPANVTISNITAQPFTDCGASATLTATTGSNFILLENGSLASRQDCRIDVYVTGSVPGSYTNTIPPTNITNDQNRQPTDNVTAGLNVTAVSGLSISLVKGFEPPQVFGGAVSTLSIELINPDGITLTGITFTDDMPMENNAPGTGIILANPPNFNVGTCGGTLTGVPGTNSFSFSGGSLPPFGTCTLTLNATMTVNGNRTNIIPAGAVKTDNLVTNADPTRASLTNLPGASVSKSFAPNPIPAGSYSLLTITIQNTGIIELIGMGVSDSLPAGLAIAGGSAPAPVNNCGGTFTAVPGTQLIQLTDGSLVANSSCTMVVAITGSAPGDYQNTIPAGALRTDPSVGATNTTPATATLTISGESSGGGGGGGGGRGRGGSSSKPTSNFLIPVTGFAPGMVTKLDPSSHPVYDATSLDIQIPVIKVDASIVGVQSRDGSWDISWLQDQIGWLNGTAYPTWRGNSVLTAHVVNADGKPGVFYRLKSLGIGEYIFVYNAGYRYTYKVVSNAYVQPDDASVMKHEDKSYLTLITCDTYDEKTATYLRRVAVQAMLVDVRPVR